MEKQDTISDCQVKEKKLIENLQKVQKLLQKLKKEKGYFRNNQIHKNKVYRNNKNLLAGKF